MRTGASLERALGRGSAKHGADHWWAQRISAVALVVLAVWLVVSLISIPIVNFVAIRAWLNHGWNAVLVIALLLAAAQHSYLGLRVVVEDYVHEAGRRVAILLILRFIHTLLAAAAVYAVFEVTFGAAI